LKKGRVSGALTGGEQPRIRQQCSAGRVRPSGRGAGASFPRIWTVGKKFFDNLPFRPLLRTRKNGTGKNKKRRPCGRTRSHAHKLTSRPKWGNAHESCAQIRRELPGVREGRLLQGVEDHDRESTAPAGRLP